MTEEELTQKFHLLHSEMEKAYTSIDSYESMMGSGNTDSKEVVAKVLTNYKILQKMKPEYDELLETFYQNIFIGNPTLKFDSSADKIYKIMIDVKLKVERTMALAEVLIEVHEDMRKLKESRLEEKKEKRFTKYLYILIGTMSVFPIILFFKNSSFTR